MFLAALIKDLQRKKAERVVSEHCKKCVFTKELSSGVGERKEREMIIFFP